MSVADDNDHVPANRFRLSLPAHTAHLQLVRLTVAALTSDLLSVDEIEDAKVAIEELTAAAMAPTHGEPDVHLGFVVDGNSLTVHGERSLHGDDLLMTHDFLTTILDAVCDHHELGATPGLASFTFQKIARGR